MSLKIWMPLTESFRNFGTDRAMMSNNGSSKNDNGRIGGCYIFDGTDDRMILSNFSLGTNWSCGCWIYAESSSRGPEGIIVVNSFGDDSETQLGIYTNPAENKIKIIANGQSYSITVTFSQWNHIFTTFNGSILKIYLNGELVDTKSITATALSGSRLTLGARRRDTSSYDCYFEGKLNDVRLYNHCLSSAEIHYIFQALIIHYKFDNIDDGIIDSSGYNNNGTIYDNVILGTGSPRYNACVHFSAETEHVRCKPITMSNFGDSFTIAWWGKRYTDTDTMFWGFSDGNRLNGLYRGTYWNTGDGTANPIQQIGSSTTIIAPTPNEWHHYAMTGDGENSYLYVDGILYGKAKTYKGITGKYLYINGWANSTGYTNTNMDMSDFRIYATPLSADDILQLYHTSMKIDNHQNIHTYEFLEDEDTITINRKGQLTADEYYELSDAKFYKTDTIASANQLIES